jgi:LacI family repressor for deo operon, udp, cdd, tsx, nupC, and nupG
LQPQKLDEKASSGDRQPTMADVARLAEVSTAAVSYFLSGREHLMRRVGAEAQERISQAVGALGYVQNKTARHLRRQRTERICVLMPKLGVPFADKVAQDVEAAARRRGFTSIVVTATGMDGFRRVLRDVEAGLADGVIADANSLDPQALGALFEPFAGVNKACVVIHAAAQEEAFSVVNYDWILALLQAAKHLYAKGHRRIAYMQNRSDYGNPRVEALRAFLKDRPGSSLVVLDGAEAREVAAAATRAMAALPERPTAVLVESDFTAVTVIEELQRLGLAVPGDVAVIGCGNAEEGFYCNPRLTTIGPKWLSLTEATEHLIDIIESRGDATPRQFTIPWTLYPRDSG